MIALESPIGRVVVVGTERLERVSLSVNPTAAPDSAETAPEATELEREAANQLAEYFRGERLEFDLPFASVGTELQQRTWALLERIPSGTAVSYGHLTRELGLPAASARAVGAAVGANPLLIVRACHRVVGANGSLTGYAGGLPAKEWLLRHEGFLL